MKLKAKQIVSIVVSAVVLVVFVALDIVAGLFGGMITDFLRPDPDMSGATEVLKASDKLCQNLAEDSIVLLRNEDDALPLKSDELKVNLFGVSAYDPSSAAAYNGFLMKGIGSGSSTISEKKAVTLQSALKKNGIDYNTDLEELYKSFGYNRGAGDNNNGGAYTLSEPAISTVREKFTSAKEYSDVAIVVFSRLGGENIGEQPKTQKDNANKTYLEISDAEEELLKAVRETFGKVIVLLNTSNVMHCGFLETYDVDAAMYVGLTGQSGAVAIGELLKGQTLDGAPLSPSGKLSDTYIYNTEFDPGFANAESTNRSGGPPHIQYSEDIYVGYRWYETAAKEGYLDYDKVVQYPFGYGLSYTTFDWEVADVSLRSGSEITNANKNETITVTVRVTNTGEVAGKEVVQLYYTPPYYDGEIEKTEVNLLDFAKTSTLDPGEVEELKLTFTAYDMASFDAYDKNKNGSATYELDHGSYAVTLRTDSHNVATCDGATINYTVGANGILFDKDPVTGEDVVTRYTGENAYAGVPTDGSNAGITQKFMSRADFEGTFPKTKAAAASNDTVVNGAASYFYTGYDTNTAPTQTGSGDLRITSGGAFNYGLIEELAEDYDSDTWEQLLNQISVSDLLSLVHNGGFGTPAVSSIGKPEVNDFDGPAGFNTNTIKGNWDGKSDAEETWTAYPCECLIGCSWNKTLNLQLGLSMGSEAEATKISGWYAPGINLHRTNYTSRNYEYYSEDPILSGNLAAQVILGAKHNGLYCYMKHFVVSESGPNGKDGQGRGWNTWVTEQALRELYLKPFEIAVKEGEANAIMSSFNRLGASWTGANHALLTDILRTEWGFKGTVVTDWSNGGGVGAMNPRQGVRAGNDTWLNPGSIGGGLQSNNATDVACARKAAHNILYTYVDTINFNQNADKSQIDAALTVNKGVAAKDDFFPWWIPVLVVIEVLAIGGCGAWVFLMFFLDKKKQAEAAEVTPVAEPETKDEN